MENRRAIEARQQSLHAELVAARQARPTSLEVLPHNYDDYNYDDYNFTYYVVYNYDDYDYIVCQAVDDASGLLEQTMMITTLPITITMFLIRRWRTRAARSSRSAGSTRRRRSTISGRHRVAPRNELRGLATFSFDAKSSLGGNSYANLLPVGRGRVGAR